jgi:hypothetical protein
MKKKKKKKMFSPIPFPIQCKYCVHMYVNGKIIPVETIPRMGGEENDGGGKFKYDIFTYSKNFCEFHNVPPPAQLKKISI